MIKLPGSVRSLLAAAALAVTGLAAAPAVDAADYHFAGASCMPDVNSQAWDINLNGIENLSGFPASFHCAIGGHPSLSGTQITGYRLNYYDRNAATNQTVNGYLYAKTSGGAIYTSGSKCSCSTAGGCTGSVCSTNTFTGAGYLSWTNPISSSATGIVNLQGAFSVPQKTAAAQGSSIESSRISY